MSTSGPLHPGGGGRLPVEQAPTRKPLRCRLGVHAMPEPSGVGHCLRGCGHYVLSRVLPGGGWIKDVAPPTGDPPRGLPPRNPPGPPPPGPPEPPRPPDYRPVS